MSRAAGGEPRALTSVTGGLGDGKAMVGPAKRRKARRMIRFMLKRSAAIPGGIAVRE